MQRRHGTGDFGFVARSFVLPEEADALAEAMRQEAGAASSGKQKATGELEVEVEMEVAGRTQTAGSRAADTKSADTANVWIVKPVASCRGQGITLHRSADGPLPHDIASRRGIASTYIHPPYLMHGRKCDLRLYVAVTSWRPLVLYLHHAGLARLATEAYALTDLDSTSKHLTNYSINKYTTPAAGGGGSNSGGGGGSRSGADGSVGGPVDTDSRPPPPPPSGPKVGLDEFRRYLASDVGEVRAAEAWRAVDAILVKTCIAAEPLMGQAVSTYLPPNGAKCFQLFGFDVMLSADCKPWVLEVNLDPSLATDSPLDLEVKASVLTDLLNLVDAGNPNRSAAAGTEAGTEVAGRAGAIEAAEAGGVTAAEAEVVRAVDAELARSQQGGWRRLHPSERSAAGEYAPFFEPSRARLHAGLPFRTA